MNIRICFKLINTTPSKYIRKKIEVAKYDIDKKDIEEIKQKLIKIVSFEKEVPEKDVIPITLDEYLDHLMEVRNE